MSKLLGKLAWNRSRKCKHVNCCTRPRWSYGSQRLREGRQWGRDEELPGMVAPKDPFVDASDCQHGCNGACATSGSERCRFTCHPVMEES